MVEPNGILCEQFPQNHDECSRLKSLTSLINMNWVCVRVFFYFLSSLYNISSSSPPSTSTSISTSSDENHDVCPFRAQRHQCHVEKWLNCGEHNGP